MKILIVDDHKMFRESVVSFLEREEFCDGVYAAATIKEAEKLISDEQIDVALVDLSFPGEGGVELVKRTRAAAPAPACVFLSMHEEITHLHAAASAGACGYVTKSAGYDELRSAVLTAKSGGLYLDQVMLGKVFAHFSRPDAAHHRTNQALDELTSREREVLGMLIQDMSIEEIGETLFISAKTVENHRSNIYRKLEVHDRMALFMFARRHGLLEETASAGRLPSDD